MIEIWAPRNTVQLYQITKCGCDCRNRNCVGARRILKTMIDEAIA